MVMSANTIKIGGAVAALLLALFCIWFYQAPYSTLTSVKEAALRRDTNELNRLIDFPSFKSSIKIMLSESMDSQPQKGKLGGMFAKALIGAIAGPIIDAMVTPESIVTMFSGALPKRTKPSTDLSQEQQLQRTIVTKSWDGLSTMRVRIQAVENQGDSVTFVMRREGLSWRLSALER